MSTRTLLAASAALAATTAHAQAAPAPDRAFQVTPYVWASGFGGTIQPLPNGPAFRASRSFGELLKDIDAAFFVSGLARFDRFVVVADVSHSSSSKDGFAPTPIPGVPLVPAQGSLRQTSATLLGGVRVADRANVAIDLLAGARAFWIRPTVAAPALGVQRSPTLDFVDPVVAARVNARLGEGWSLLAYGDVGGLGAGSDFTTQGVVTVNARVARGLWLSAGYRALVVDYSKNGRRADVSLGGPLLGATFTF